MISKHLGFLVNAPHLQYNTKLVLICNNFSLPTENDDETTELQQNLDDPTLTVVLTSNSCVGSVVGGIGARDAGGGISTTGTGCGSVINTGKRRFSLAQKMTSNLRRLSGAPELKIDINEASPINNPKFLNKKIKVSGNYIYVYKTKSI